MTVGVGLSLQPEQRYLELLGDLLRTGPDYFEVAPETCWRPGPDGAFEPNGYHQTFLELGKETGKSFVAHGVGFSVGSAAPDAARRERWMKAIANDYAQFQFMWYTDHLGVSVLDGREVLLPLGLPYTDSAADAVARSLATLQTVVADVGVENSAFYYHLGNPLDESAWLAKCLAAPHTHLLLDLHNVHTTAINTGMDPNAYIQGLPLEQVIEIHVSGGSWSEPGWLPSGRVMRLDSHDATVPEEVWKLLEKVLPRCPNLRGITLERMEGTVEASDVPIITEELARIRHTLDRMHVL